MIKKITLLAFVVLLISCSKSSDDVVAPNNADDDPDNPVETFLIAISIVGSVFSEAYQGHLYLSDSEGNIIADGGLQNNQTTSLSAVFDLNNSYDATIVYKINASPDEVYTASTYQNVRPETYTITRVPSTNPNGDRIILDMYNTGFPLQVISTSGSGYNGSGNASNGGSFNFNGSLAASPGDYFASFKSENDEYSRYFWMENVAANATFELDYQSLTLLDDLLTIEFPSQEEQTLLVQGFKSDDPHNIAHQIKVSYLPFGGSPEELFLPMDVFDFYRFIATYNIGNLHYTLVAHGPIINTTILAPDLNLDFNSTSIGNFSMDTTGQHDAYSVNFNYSDNDALLHVIYKVFGASSSEVTFNKTNLFNQIFAAIPEFNASLLQFGGASIAEDNGASSYNQYMKKLIESNSQPAINNRVETVSRTE